jgi:predicted transcriptional regulator
MARGSRLDNLKAQRGTMGITELAKKANVSDALIRQLESGGNCNPDEGQRIADALGVPLATLGQ